jgi:hypothetical protein
VVFVTVRDETGPCALAAFEPTFPSIYPIGAARPEHARPLFDALFPHARDSRTHLFVEGNAGLAEALRGVGADLAFEVLRMAAPLQMKETLSPGIEI